MFVVLVEENVLLVLVRVVVNWRAEDVTFYVDQE